MQTNQLSKKNLLKTILIAQALVSALMLTGSVIFALIMKELPIIYGMALGLGASTLNTLLVFRQANKIVDYYKTFKHKKTYSTYFIIRMLVVVLVIGISIKVSMAMVLSSFIGIAVSKLTIYISQLKNKGVNEWT